MWAQSRPFPYISGSCSLGPVSRQAQTSKPMKLLKKPLYREPGQSSHPTAFVYTSYCSSCSTWYPHATLCMACVATSSLCTQSHEDCLVSCVCISLLCPAIKRIFESYETPVSWGYSLGSQHPSEQQNVIHLTSVFLPTMDIPHTVKSSSCHSTFAFILRGL